LEAVGVAVGGDTAFEVACAGTAGGGIEGGARREIVNDLGGGTGGCIVVMLLEELETDAEIARKVAKCKHICLNSMKSKKEKVDNKKKKASEFFSGKVKKRVSDFEKKKTKLGKKAVQNTATNVSFKTKGKNIIRMNR
jgi:hypothetical protein